MDNYDSSSTKTDFQPTESMQLFVDTAIKTLSTNVAELCRQTGIDESTYYKWLKKDGFIDWFNDEWAEGTKDLNWKLKAVAIRKALSGDFRYWKELYSQKSHDDNNITVRVIEIP